jgi:hypothetical protein
MMYRVFGLPIKAKTMVEDVYKLAEKKMLTTATEMNLIRQSPRKCRAHI